MSTVVVDGPTRDKLLAAGGVVEVRDEAGAVIGEFKPLPPAPPQRPGPGLAKGMIVILEDDDEHLKDFAEYMP